MTNREIIWDMVPERSSASNPVDTLPGPIGPTPLLHRLSIGNGFQLHATKDYCNGVIYSGNSVERVLVDGGYITFSNNVPVYHYYLKDHLGSNRMVVSATGDIEQINTYYPFGASRKDSENNGQTQTYKYTGKELEGGNLLYWYDYGARWYDAVLGRFTTMDPLCEEDYSVSPYVYCRDNPIKYVDKIGLAPGDFFESVDAAAIDFGMYYNGISILQNKEYASSIYFVVNKNNKVGFTYTVANSGTQDTSIHSAPPKGAFVAALAHTHGGYDSKYRNNDFSGLWRSNAITAEEYKERAPRMNQKQKEYDIGNSNKRGLPSYLATPNGTLQKYNPRTGEVSIISTELPSDANDPMRKNHNSPESTTTHINTNTNNLNIFNLLLVKELFNYITNLSR